MTDDLCVKSVSQPGTLNRPDHRADSKTTAASEAAQTDESAVACKPVRTGRVGTSVVS